MSGAATVLDERFTLYLNTAGNPVRRTLHEMTADEVLAAIEWAAEEAERFERAAEPFKHTDELAAWEAGEISADEMRSRTEHGLAMLNASIEASNRSIRLERAVIAAMPEWRRHPDVRLPVALRRWWRGEAA